MEVNYLNAEENNYEDLLKEELYKLPDDPTDIEYSTGTKHGVEDKNEDDIIKPTTPKAASEEVDELSELFEDAVMNETDVYSDYSQSPFHEEDNEEEEEDFFAENKEEGELQYHLSDEYLENFQKELAQRTYQKRNSDSTLETITSSSNISEVEQTQFDVHGILNPLKDETPEQVFRALDELKIEIDHLKDATAGKDHDAYCMAESQSKSFVEDKSFRLMFLRCELYNVKAAACRIFKFFTLKLDLWGSGKLTKTITLEDFDPYDLEVLQHANVQILPLRDHANRSIVLNNMNDIYYREPINYVGIRVYFYTFSLIACLSA